LDKVRRCLLQSGPDTYICLGGLVAELDKSRGCLFYRVGQIHIFVAYVSLLRSWIRHADVCYRVGQIRIFVKEALLRSWLIHADVCYRVGQIRIFV